MNLLCLQQPFHIYLEHLIMMRCQENIMHVLVLKTRIIVIHIFVKPIVYLHLHTDGTFVDEPTDWLLMMKMIEQNARGGESRLLHLDDWKELDNVR